MIVPNDDAFIPRRMNGENELINLSFCKNKIRHPKPNHFTIMRGLLSLVFLVTAATSWGQSITINNPSPIIICPGSDLTLQFSHTGINTDNVFTIAISDQLGNFTTPIATTTVSGNVANSAIISVPVAAVYSSNYQIRITASSPNTSRQAYLSIGVPTPYVVGSSFCENGFIELRGGSSVNNTYYPPGYTFSWLKDNVDISTTNETTEYIKFLKVFGANGNDAGEYKVKMSASPEAGGCSVTSSGKAITMKPAPASPTVSASVNPVISGGTTIITATGCTSAAYWFDKPVETALPYSWLGIDYMAPHNYTTGEVTQPKTYYVACQGTNQCYSTRTTYTVNVDATNAPLPPTLIGNNEICFDTYSKNIRATNCSGIVRWYNHPTSQIPLEIDNQAPYEYVFTPFPLNTYTYYADCRINNVLSTTRSSITIVTKSVPVMPDLFPGNPVINQGSTISIYATNCPNGIVKWFDTEQGTNLLFTGNPYIRNDITANATFYASCKSDGCESPRRSVNISVTNEVFAPSLYTQSLRVCGSETRTFQAIGCSNGTVKWYDSNQNGNLLATGQTYTTPLLTYNPSGNNFYTYYSDCTINGITSSDRSSRSISVYPAPNTPTTSNTSIACNANATLTASGCNGYYSYRWYSSQTASDYLSAQSSYVTPTLRANKTYYVACIGDGNCESVRIAVLVTVQCPQSPVISANPGSAICAENNVTLTANGCSGGIVNWNDGGSGTNRIITPLESFTLTASCTVNGATSDPSNLLYITVNPKPILVITNPAAVSPPNTVNLTVPAVTVGSTFPSGTTLSYYMNAGATTSLNNPSAVGASGIYYIKAASADGCIDIKPVVVTISNCNSPITLFSTADDYNSGTQLKKTNETITATNKLTGTANVIYLSGKSVTLNQGFKVDNGTVFKAEIGDCN